MAAAQQHNRSLIWNYFEKLESGKAKCKQKDCGKELACSSGQTTSLARHLEAKHKKEHAEYLEAKSIKDREREELKRKNTDNSSHSQQMKQAKLSFKSPGVDVELQKKFNDALIEHIAENHCSFSQFGSQSFASLINVANKKLTIPHPTTLSRMASFKAKTVLSQVCDIIAAVKQDLLSVCFTTDLWTSRTGDSYISLTSSFNDKEWNLHNWTPFVR